MFLYNNHSTLKSQIYFFWQIALTSVSLVSKCNFRLYLLRYNVLGFFVMLSKELFFFLLCPETITSESLTAYLTAAYMPWHAVTLMCYYPS